MKSSNLISHVCGTRKFENAILHWKQGLLCDKEPSRDASILIAYTHPIPGTLDRTNLFERHQTRKLGGGGGGGSKQGHLTFDLSQDPQYHCCKAVTPLCVFFCKISVFTCQVEVWFDPLPDENFLD